VATFSLLFSERNFQKEVEMKEKWLFGVGLVALLIVAALTGCSAGPVVRGELPSNIQVSLNGQQGIWVTGEGKVTVVPDIATLRLGISAQTASVAEAQSQATEAMNKVMAALTNNGVSKKDIQTQYFSIQQVTRWDRVKEEEVVIGYRVTNMVAAKIREIDKTGAIIDAVVAAGGDFTRIDSVSFSVDEPSAYHEEARQKAMADARTKAEQLAKLAGVTLGKPTYISESIYMPSPIYPARMAEGIPVPAPAPTPISPGETEISLTVQVSYAIL